MEIARPYLYPIAVVDEFDGSVVVWHVDVGPDDLDMGRLCGAWVLSATDVDVIENLVHGRAVFDCNNSPTLRALATSTSGSIDVDATVAAVIAERDALQRRYVEFAAVSKSKLVAPDWPEVIHPKQIAADVPRTEEVARQTGDAFPMARGFKELAEAWERIEKQRLRREFLHDPAGSSARPVPVVTG